MALELPIEASITFHSLFKEKLSQGALKHELARIKSKYPRLLYSKENRMMELYTDLVVNNPNVSLKDLMSAMGYRALLEENASREVKGLAGKTSQEWYKFKTKAETLKFTNKKRNCFSVLEEGLIDFKPMALKDYLKNE